MAPAGVCSNGENLLNRDIEAAWRYHNGTKLSWQSVHSIGHYLDWSNKPIPFKIYPHLEGEKLPGDLPSSGVPALAGSPAQVEEWVPTRRDLARLFYFAAGITKRGVFPGGEIYFRAAACTGALYHIEIYLVCGDLPDLPAGVYHFGPHDFALRRLREGDYRGVLVEATCDEPAVSVAPAVRSPPRSIGATPGSPRPGPTGTPIGTAAPFWLTCWRLERLTGYP